MSLSKYTWGQIRRRPGRTLLTLAGITIGVAAIVAVWVTTNTTRHTYRSMFESLTGRASLEVVAEGLGGFDPKTAGDLREVPGVHETLEVIQSSTALVGREGVVAVMILGVDPSRDQSARDYSLRSGRLLAGDDEILLEARFAERNGLKLGAPARLLTPGGTATLTVVGLLEREGPALSRGGAVVFMPLSTAQRWFELAGQINSVQLVLDEKANPNHVSKAISARLPVGLRVQVPAFRGAVAQDSLLSTEQALGMLSVVSLVAGAFVILNSFLMNLGERRRQIAILRALGTTQSQVTRILLRESFILGVVGAALGIGAGAGLAVLFRRGMQQLLSITLADLVWSPGPIIAALVAGPLVALLATYVPARREGRRPTLEGLLDVRDPRGETLRRWPLYLGMALLALPCLMLAALFAGWISAQTVSALLPPSTASFLVGCVLIVPSVVTPLLRGVNRLCGRFLGVEGLLAYRQLDRQRARTGLTVGVLMIALVVTISMGNSLLTNIGDVGDWQERAVSVDFIVRSVVPDTGTITAAALPAGLDKELEALPGVERVDRLSFVTTRIDKQPVVILAKSFTPGERVHLDMDQGDPEKIVDQLIAGQVVVGTVLAHRLELVLGDTVTLNTRRGPIPLKIAGTVTEYTAGGSAIYMDWNAADRLLNVRNVDALMLTARPGEYDVLGKELKTFCADRHLMLQSESDFRTMIDQMVNGVVGFLWILMILVFVVASLGIVNTLTMNMLEQTRELGVLRAVAMTRRQVRKILIVQALLLGLVSLVPGVIVGLLLAALMNVSTVAVTGHPVDFHLNPTFILQCGAAALVVALLASLVPAERAARLEVIRALQYE